MDLSAWVAFGQQVAAAVSPAPSGSFSGGSAVLEVFDVDWRSVTRTTVKTRMLRHGKHPSALHTQYTHLGDRKLSSQMLAQLLTSASPTLDPAGEQRRAGALGNKNLLQQLCA